jgi:sucrose-phosphate synthase
VRVARRLIVIRRDGFFITLLSMHGLIRGDDPELGRDADTGGQVQYVLELARALSDHPDVARVELMTRQILSINVDHEYGEHREQIAEKAWLVRLPFGPHRYLRKESLWPYLPQFVDEILAHYRHLGRVPDLIHGHYADAGDVAVTLGRLLDVPVVHTGHSLGRVKLQRLLAKGLSAETIEQRYRIGRRIAAEERVLEHADLIVASTRQEVDEQYAMYEHDVADRVEVIPPGVNLDRFRPPEPGERFTFADEIDRFLAEPDKPLILAIQRPDERKNLAGLIRAYGESDRLREMANLVLVIGSRDDIRELPKGQRQALTEMLLLVDRYDLYGLVAYPKNHTADDVAELYRLAASRRGVFVNPALTEPFGLTLIEAAASGLPIIATRDGGPREIVELCENGVLVDPLDTESISSGLVEVLSDEVMWERRSESGIRGADRNFSWNGHVKRYLGELRRRDMLETGGSPGAAQRLVVAEGLLVCDIDNTLIGDRGALDEFVEWIERHRDGVAFALATGRVLEHALEVVEEWGVPAPDALISGVGSRITYRRSDLVEDLGWSCRIARGWDRDALERCLAVVPGLRLQAERHQRDFKLSYTVDHRQWPGIRAVRRRIKERSLEANLVFSHREFLDVLPKPASKGRAVRYLANRWGYGLSEVLVAGDSGNDTDMLTCGARGVVVGNHSPELNSLRGHQHVVFTEASHARGILEGIEAHRFMSSETVAARGRY